MSTLKDKLSANMRAVKAGHNADKSETEAGKTAATPAKKARKSATKRPAAKRPTPKPVVAVAPKPKAPPSVSGNTPPENSNNTLFPARVWPD